MNTKLPIFFVCFLTILRSEIVEIKNPDIGRIHSVYPLGDNDIVVSNNGDKNHIFLLDNKGKVLFKIRDGGLGKGLILTNKINYYSMSFDGKYVYLGTQCDPLGTVYRNCEFFKVSVQDGEITKILSRDDLMVVKIFTGETISGKVEYIGFPAVNGDTLYFNVKLLYGDNKSYQGILEKKGGIYRELVARGQENQRFKLQLESPVALSFDAKTLLFGTDLVPGTEIWSYNLVTTKKNLLFSSGQIVDGVQFPATNFAPRIQYNFPNQVLYVKDYFESVAFKVFPETGLIYSRRFPLNDGLNTDQVIANGTLFSNGLSALGTNRDGSSSLMDQVVVVINKELFPIITKDDSVGGIKVGKIGSSVSPHQCSVTVFTTENRLLSVKKPLIDNVKINDNGNLEFNGCFLGLTHGNMQLFANGVQLTPRYIDNVVEISDRKIEIKMIPVLSGQTEFYIHRFFPSEDSNKVFIYLPITSLQVTATVNKNIIKPGENINLALDSNVPTNATITITPSTGVVITPPSQFNISGGVKTSSQKVQARTETLINGIIRNCVITIEFVAQNGSREVVEIPISVLDPVINKVTAGIDEDKNERKIFPGSLVILEGSNLSGDGKDYNTFENPLIELAGVTVFVNGRPAPIYYMTETYFVIQVPAETEVSEETWIEFRRNDSNAVFKFTVQKNEN